MTQVMKQVPSSLSFLKEFLRFQLKDDLLWRHYFNLLIPKHEHYVFSQLLTEPLNLIFRSEDFKSSIHNDRAYSLYNDEMQMEYIKDCIRQFDEVNKLSELKVGEESALWTYFLLITQHTKSDAAPYLIVLQAHYIDVFLQGIYWSLDPVFFKNEKHEQFLKFMLEEKKLNLAKQITFARHKKYPILKKLEALGNENLFTSPIVSVDKPIIINQGNVLCAQNDSLQQAKNNWENTKNLQIKEDLFLAYEKILREAPNDEAKAIHLLFWVDEYLKKPRLLKKQLMDMKSQLDSVEAIYKVAIQQVNESRFENGLQNAYLKSAQVCELLAKKFPPYSLAQRNYFSQAKADYYTVLKENLKTDNFMSLYLQGRATKNSLNSLNFYTEAIKLNLYFWEAHYQRLLAYYDAYALMQGIRVQPYFAVLKKSTQPILAFLKCVTNPRDKGDNAAVFLNKLIKVNIHNNAAHPLYFKVSFIEGSYLLHCSNEFDLMLLLQSGKESMVLVDEEQVLLHHYDAPRFLQLVEQSENKIAYFKQYIHYFEEYHLVNHQAPLEKQIILLKTLPACRQVLIEHFFEQKKYSKANLHIAKALNDYQHLLSFVCKTEAEELQQNIRQLKLKRAAIYQKLNYLHCEEEELHSILETVSRSTKLYFGIHYRLACLAKEKGDLQKYQEYSYRIVDQKQRAKAERYPVGAELSVEQRKCNQEADSLLKKYNPDERIEKASHVFFNEVLQRGFGESQAESLERVRKLCTHVANAQSIKEFYELIICPQGNEHAEFWLGMANLYSDIDLKRELHLFKEQFFNSIASFQKQQKKQLDTLIFKQAELKNKEEQIKSVIVLKNKLLESLSQNQYMNPNQDKHKSLMSAVQSSADLMEKVERINSILNIELKPDEQKYIKAKQEFASWYVHLVSTALEPPQFWLNEKELKIDGYTVYLSQLIEEIKERLQLKSYDTVVINAANVFFDSSLTSTEWQGINLSVSAQYIEFVGAVSINLSGKNGLSGAPVENQPNATRPGENGKPGLPGNHGEEGQHGGDLSLIAYKEIRNKKNLLELNVSGGQGGVGGNGGNGGDGKQGDDGTNGETEEPSWGSISDGYWCFAPGTLGTHGGCGGTGGAAGLGGHGGASGRILIKENSLDSSNQFKACIKNENYAAIVAIDGKPGEGGVGGLGGIDGYDELRIKPGFWRKMRVERARGIVITENGKFDGLDLAAPDVPLKWRSDESDEHSLRQRKQGRKGNQGLSAQMQRTTGNKRTQAAQKTQRNENQQHNLLVAQAQTEQALAMDLAQNENEQDVREAEVQAQQNNLNMLGAMVGLSTQYQKNTEVSISNQQQITQEHKPSVTNNLFAPRMQMTITPDSPEEPKVNSRALEKKFNKPVKPELDELDDPLLDELCGNLFK